MPTPHEFSIPVTSLDAAGRSHRFPVRAAWMKTVLEGHQADATDADGELDVRLSRSGNDVVVVGTLKAELMAPCARCLDPVKIPVNQAISTLMVPAAQVKPPGSDDYEFAPDEDFALGFFFLDVDENTRKKAVELSPFALLVVNG